MSRTVFILGAGASKEAGAPLMNDFLDVAEEIKNAHSQELSQEEKEWFGDVFEGLYELQRVHEKATLDTLNIEDVFAAFEMGILVKKLGGLNQEKIQKLDKAMRKVIAKTLETAIEFPIHDTKTLLPPPSYKHFVHLLDELGKHSGGIDQISIITFNYDLALDYALYYSGKQYDYGIIDRSPSILSLFKLHGSLNWAKCQKCGSLQSWHLSDFNKGDRLGKLFFADNEIARGRLRFSAYLNQYRHSDLCEGFLESEPAIVPPTWIKKSEYSVTLSNVWKRAAEELSSAENIFVIGYSLPSTDLFFRYLFGIGTMSPTRVKKFWVFNPDKEVDMKFQELLGPTTKYRYEFREMTFTQAIQNLSKDHPYVTYLKMRSEELKSKS